MTYEYAQPKFVKSPAHQNGRFTGSQGRVLTVTGGNLFGPQARATIDRERLEFERLSGSRFERAALCQFYDILASVEYFQYRVIRANPLQWSVVRQALNASLAKVYGQQQALAVEGRNMRPGDVLKSAEGKSDEGHLGVVLYVGAAKLLNQVLVYDNIGAWEYQAPNWNILPKFAPNHLSNIVAVERPNYRGAVTPADIALAATFVKFKGYDYVDSWYLGKTNCQGWVNKLLSSLGSTHSYADTVVKERSLFVGDAKRVVFGTRIWTHKDAGF